MRCSVLHCCGVLLSVPLLHCVMGAAECASLVPVLCVCGSGEHLERVFESDWQKACERLGGFLSKQVQGDAEGEVGRVRDELSRATAQLYAIFE